MKANQISSSRNYSRRRRILVITAAFAFLAAIVATPIFNRFMDVDASGIARSVIVELNGDPRQSGRLEQKSRAELFPRSNFRITATR